MSKVILQLTESGLDKSLHARRYVGKKLVVALKFFITSMLSYAKDFNIVYGMLLIWRLIFMF